MNLATPNKRSRPLAALLEPLFAPREGRGGAVGLPYISTAQQLLEASAVLLRCLVVQADGRVTEEEEALLVAAGAALFGDDEGAPFLRRLLGRLEERAVDQGALGRALREAYPEPTRKLLLLLALEAAYADGELQPEEEQLIRRLQRDLAIDDAEAVVLRIVAGEAPLQWLDHIRAAPARVAALRALHGELAPSGFAGLRGCPGLHHVLQRAYAALDELTRAHSAATGVGRPSHELDTALHAELRRCRTDVERLGEALVQLRLAVGAPELALLDGLSKVLAEAHQRLAAGRFSVTVIGDFNAGKSSFVNALLGDEPLPTGGHPCTATVTVVRHAPKRGLTARFRSRPDEEVTLDPTRFREMARIPPMEDFAAADETIDSLDLERLVLSGPFPFCQSGIELVDTPGLNEVAHRTPFTLRHLREGDVGILVSNATQPPRSSEQEIVARLLDDCPGKLILVVVSHWDQVDPEDQAAVQARYRDFVAGLGARRGRAALRYICAPRALAALRQPPIADRPDPWLGAFRDFRREIVGYLARVRGPGQVGQLRRGILGVAADAESISAARLADVKRRDVAGAERELDALRRASSLLESDLDAAGEQFSAHVAGLCGSFVDRVLRELGGSAAGWTTTHDPRWPGNSAKIREDFEKQARQHFERSFRGWSRESFPSLLTGKIREVEARNREEIETLRAALAPFRRDRGGPETGSVLLSLSRIAGRWPLFDPLEILDLTWEEIGVTMAGHLGDGVVAGLLSAGGQVAAAIAAGVGLVLILRGKDNLVEKIREGVVEGMQQDGHRIVAVARDMCRDATRESVRELTERIVQGLLRLVESGATRLALVRGDSRPDSPQLQRLERAHDACARIRQELATPADAREAARARVRPMGGVPARPETS